MPMNSVFDRKIILNQDLKVISLLDFDQRTGLLIIDEIDVTCESVLETVSLPAPQRNRHSRHPARHLPGALDPLWSVKLYVRRAAAAG